MSELKVSSIRTNTPGVPVAFPDGITAEGSALLTPADLAAALASTTLLDTSVSTIPLGATRTQTAINSDTITLEGVGGDANFDFATKTGPNSFDAVLGRGRAKPGSVIRIPFKPGKTNIVALMYPVNYPLGLPGEEVIFDVDEGVQFYVENVDISAVKMNRVVTVLNQSPNWVPTKVGANTAFPQPMSTKQRGDFVTHGDFTSSRFYRPDVSAWRAKAYFWPGSPDAGGSDLEVGDASSKMTFSETGVVFAGAGDGTYNQAELTLAVGDRLHFRLLRPSGDASLTPACFGRTALGFYGLTWTGGQIGLVEKEAGGAATNAAIDSGLDGYRQLHATYIAESAFVTFVRTGVCSFNILVNGVLFYRKVTKVPLQGFSIGGYYAGAEVNASATDIWIEKGASSSTSGLLGLFYIGDSRQSPTAGNPANYCARYLEGSQGIRVVKLVNQAIAGEAAAQQLAHLQATGVPSGITDAVVAIGTNDVQSLTPVATFKGQVIQMVDILQAKRVRVVIDLFPLWYTRDQAGLRGQNSTRYGLTDAYRAALIEVAKEKDCVVVDGLTEFGPIIANFVNPNTSPNLVGFEPVLDDNIHGGMVLGGLQGYAHARAILGQIAKVQEKCFPWATVPSPWDAQNGWVRASAGPNRYRMTDGGEVEFDLNLTINAAARADGTAVFGFGRFLQPAAPVIIPVMTDTNYPGTVVVGIDGAVKIYGLSAATGTTLRIASRPYTQL